MDSDKETIYVKLESYGENALKEQHFTMKEQFYQRGYCELTYTNNMV